jgi:hypothetical protein
MTPLNINDGQLWSDAYVIGRARAGGNAAARGKYAGCKLTWLSDQDLWDLYDLSTDFHFRYVCRGMLITRWLARRRRIHPRKNH